MVPANPQWRRSPGLGLCPPTPPAKLLGSQGDFSEGPSREGVTPKCQATQQEPGRGLVVASERCQLRVASPGGWAASLDADEQFICTSALGAWSFLEALKSHCLYFIRGAWPRGGLEAEPSCRVGLRTAVVMRPLPAVPQPAPALEPSPLRWSGFGRGFWLLRSNHQCPQAKTPLTPSPWQ